jgi:hypothetical protein
VRKRGFELALLCCLFSCGPALAADPAVPPPIEASPVTPAPVEADAPTASKIIPAGTIVTLELTEALSASHAQSGDHFGLRLAEPIMIDGDVVVPAGVTGQGEVIDAKPAGIGGRPGRLILAARYLENGDLRLKLQSFKIGGAGGRDNSGLAVGATIAIGIVGALVPGGGVEYPPGARATAKISSDVTIPPGPPAGPPSSDPTPKP